MAERERRKSAQRAQYHEEVEEEDVEEEEQPQPSRKRKQQQRQDSPDYLEEDHKRRKGNREEEMFKLHVQASQSKDKGDGEEVIENDDFEEEEEEDMFGEDGLPENLSQNGIGEKEAMIGIIDSVEVINFMCHSHFLLEFGPHINFITGPNGSGKSAVLTAITVCLGGKASVTNRGSNMKAFIKSGENYAVIRVSIRNRGEDSFRHDLYGDSILVERRIDHSGVSTYKLKSKTGAVVSKTRDELLSILDHYNIQVENPMTILSQDIAREFLNATSAQDKYKFFMKGTQLEQISQDYLYIQEQKQIIKDTINTKKENIPDMRNEVERLSTKLKEIQQLRKLEEHIDQIKNQMAWALVVEKEQELAHYQGDVEKLQKKLTPINAKIEEIKSKTQDVTETITKFQDEQKEIVHEQEIRRTNLLELKKQIQGEQAEFTKAVNEAREIEKNIRSIKVQIRSLDSQLLEENKRIAGNTVSKRENQLLRVQQLENDIQRLQELHTLTKREKEQLDNQFAGVKDQAENIKQKCDEAAETVSRSTQKLRYLNSQKEDSLRRYGDNIPQVLQTIQREQNRFRYPPIGPIGRHIKLKDKKWAAAMDALIGNLLGQFIVQDFEDAKLLQRILKQNHCHNGVVVRKGTGCPDVSRYMPDQKFLVSMEILDIEIPVILAYLIDVRQLEKTILIETYDQARGVMYKERPKNVDACFTLRAQKLQYQGSSVSFLSMHSNKNNNFDDVDQQIRDVQFALENQRNNLDAFNREKQTVYEEYKSLESKSSELKKKLNLQQNELGKKQRELGYAREEIEQEMPSKISALEEQKAEFEKEIEILSGQYQSVVDASQKFKNAMEAPKSQIKEIEAEVRALANDIQEIQMKIDQILNDQANFSNNLSHYEKRKTEIVNKLQGMRNTETNMIEELERTISQTMESFPERVEVRKTAKSLDLELKNLTRSLAAKEKEIGRYEDIEREFELKRNEYQTIKKAIKSNIRFLKRLQMALDERITRWFEYRKYIAMRARMIFTQSLQNRGYHGQIKFNHKEQKLALFMETSETRQLSGGERSFATVSFLLALWEAMECPFRALDEYDVYMDAVNRRISTKMVIDAARISKHRQFIIITPQDMSHVEIGEDVTVVRLDPPERGASQRS